MADQNRDVPLDGLRGVAVLLVIALHLGYFAAGWLGVQLFFVLSGFLITRILVREAGQHPLKSYLGGFYQRRALRILPALYLYLALVAIAVWWIGNLQPVSNRLFASSLFYFNFHALLETRGLPWGNGSSFMVNHLWSLAVEEHFYLLWPLVVFFAVRSGRLFQVVLVCIVAGPALRWGATEFWLAQGWDEGEAGALAALMVQHQGRLSAAGSLSFWLAAALAACALGIWNNGAWSLLRDGLDTLGYPALMREGSQYIWGYSLLNLLFAQLICLSLRHPLLRAGLSWRPLTFTGGISYGLYLIHFPVILLCRPLSPEIQAMVPFPVLAAALWLALYLFVAIGLAWLSFHFYEQPFLRLKARLGAKAPAVGAPQAPVAATALVST
jgi:peptidoglycan/LPS O-acetylase OafA/YrhL